MSQQKKIIKTETKACDLCGNMGRVTAVEMLPGGGILFECHHGKRKMHEWAEYKGFEDLRNIKVDRDSSTEMKCPKCSEIGVIKTERDDTKRPDRYSYRISHPDGRRCRLSGKNRDEVLKILSRYIPNTAEQQSLSKQETHRKNRHLEQIVCPECEKVGGAADYKKSLTVVHQTGNGKNVQHKMQTIVQKQRFLNAVTTNTLSSYRKQQVENGILKAEKEALIDYFQSVNHEGASILRRYIGLEK